MVVQELSHEYSVRRRLRRRQAEAAATKTVSALLPRLHVENASAMRPVDALRAWLRDNIPSTALPVSMRRLRNTPRPAARTTTKAKQRA